MKWNEWFEGFDLEPLQSDLSELCGNLPMSWEWVSLSIWLEMSDLTKPYQSDQNRWEMNELRWIEWNEWIEGFDFVNPMGMVPMVERDEPYQSDLVDLNENVPIKMNGFNEIWMNWSE